MLYKQLVENARDMIYRMNGAGNFVYVNPTAMRITGYSEDELIGMHFSQLLREDYKDFAINFYMQQLEKKRPQPILNFRL